MNIIRALLRCLRRALLAGLPHGDGVYVRELTGAERAAALREHWPC